jgi:hypothetical protein
MGLDPDTPVDYDKLNRIKTQQFERRKVKEKQVKKYCNLCDLKLYYEKLTKYLKTKINIKNWDKLESAISYFENKLFIINQEITLLDEKLSTRT